MRRFSTRTLHRGRPRLRAGLLTLALLATVGAFGTDATAGGRVHARLTTPKPSKTKYPTLGNPKAPITVMVFADLQCPWSKRLNDRVLRQLVKDYGNKVRVVWRDFPLSLHRGALPAAIAGREVFRQKGNAAYWRFHALVYANIRQINEQQLADWAQQVGANRAKVLAALRTQAHKARVDADIRAGKALGVRGTPSSFVYRTSAGLRTAQPVRGSRNYASFKAIVDRF